jgi:two-component system sensor histidine kinase KdpD
LRSPLTGITTAVGALRRDDLVFSDEDRRELLDTIAVDAERLSRLVGDLLDLSRLEAGGAEPEPEVWSLDELVRGAVAGVTDPGRVEVAGEQPLVNVDAVQIERVLANLLENALKFSPPETTVHVRITATRQEAIVRVVDQGPGVDEQELERVFEPFYRGSNRAGAGFAGAGAGYESTHSGRRRRAADPACAGHDAARRGVHGRHRGDRRRGARGRSCASARGDHPRPRAP